MPHPYLSEVNQKPPIDFQGSLEEWFCVNVPK